MQTEVGELDINFREITTPTLVRKVLLPSAVWATQKDRQRYSNCNPRYSIRMLPSVLTPSEDALSLISGNPVWLLSELRNWDYSLPIINFCILFHSTASY